MHTQSHESAAADSSPLADLLTLSEYRERRSHIFGADESVRWYLRQHRQELLARGALLHIHGRLWINPPAFDAYVIEEGQKAAVRRGGQV